MLLHALILRTSTASIKYKNKYKILTLYLHILKINNFGSGCIDHPFLLRDFGEIRLQYWN